MQLQVELRKSLTKVLQELLRITKVLEPGHEVISEPHRRPCPSSCRCLHCLAHWSNT